MAIDEKKLIEELEIQIERERNKCNDMVELNLGDLVAKYNHGEFCYVNALHLVQTQPKVGEWIPCSERLPENEKEVLITIWGDSVYIGWLDSLDGTWITEDFACDEETVSAWMPLPEPYKKQ